MLPRQTPFDKVLNFSYFKIKSFVAVDCNFFKFMVEFVSVLTIFDSFSFSKNHKIQGMAELRRRLFESDDLVSAP